MADQRDAAAVGSAVGLRRPLRTVALELLDGALEGELDLVELERLEMYSKAPAFMASTAVSTEPKPVIMMTWVRGWAARNSRRTSSPLVCAMRMSVSTMSNASLAAPVEGLLTAVGLGHLVSPLAEDFLQHEAVFAVILDEEDPDVLHRFPGIRGGLSTVGPSPRRAPERLSLSQNRGRIALELPLPRGYLPDDPMTSINLLLELEELVLHPVLAVVERRDCCRSRLLQADLMPA